MAFRATPSSMPAKIRKIVAAKCQANSNKRDEEDHADAADRYRPCEVVAGLKALLGRTCHDVPFLHPAWPGHSFDKTRPGIKLASPPV